jgi:hypothetical protein
MKMRLPLAESPGFVWARASVATIGRRNKETFVIFNASR